MQLMWLCLCRKRNVTQDLHPFDCSEEGSLDTKRNPTLTVSVLFQHEHVLLVFSSGLVNHGSHPKDCLPNMKLTVVALTLTVDFMLQQICITEC